MTINYFIKKNTSITFFLLTLKKSCYIFHTDEIDKTPNQEGISSLVTTHYQTGINP